MSQDPNPENSIGSPFIIKTGTQVWKPYPRNGGTVMMKLHFAIVVYSSTIILLVCSVSLVSSAQVDVSAKTAEDGVLSSGLLLDLFFFLFNRSQGKTYKWAAGKVCLLHFRTQKSFKKRNMARST